MDFGTRENEMSMKRYIVSLLVRQAKADHSFSTQEKRYLAYTGQTLGLSDTEIAAIRKDPDAFEIAPPPDESQRMTILYYLLFMMRADGQVAPEEEFLCHQIGFQLGFRQEMIDNLIDVMKRYIREEIPNDEMLERVKPYLN